MEEKAAAVWSAAATGANNTAVSARLGRGCVDPRPPRPLPPLAVVGTEAGWGLGPALSSALGCTLGGGGRPLGGSWAGNGSGGLLIQPADR